MALDFNFNFDFEKISLDKLYKDANKHGEVDLSSDQKNIVSKSTTTKTNEYGGSSSNQSETLDLTSSINNNKNTSINTNTPNNNSTISQNTINTSEQSSNMNINHFSNSTSRISTNSANTINLSDNTININSGSYNGNNNSINPDISIASTEPTQPVNHTATASANNIDVTDIIDFIKGNNIGKKIINGIEISKNILEYLLANDLITQIDTISTIEENNTEYIVFEMKDGIKYVFEKASGSIHRIIIQDGTVKMSDGTIYKYNIETGALESVKTIDGVFQKFDPNTGEILYIVTPKGSTIATIEGTIEIDLNSFGTAEYTGRYLQVTDENGIKHIIPLCGFERNENGFIQIPYTEEEIKDLYNLVAIYYDKINELSEVYNENFKTKVYNNLNEVIITKFVDNVENSFAGLTIHSKDEQGVSNIAINFKQLLQNVSSVDRYASTFTHELVHVFDHTFAMNAAPQISDSTMWQNVFEHIYNEENSIKLDNISMEANECEWFARTLQIYYKNPEDLKDIELNIDGFATLYDLAKFLVEIDSINLIIGEANGHSNGLSSYFSSLLKEIFDENKENGNKVYISIEDFILEDNDGNIYQENGTQRILEVVFVNSQAILVSINGKEYILKIIEGSRATIIGVKDYIN